VKRNRKAGQNPPRFVAPVEEEEEEEEEVVYYAACTANFIPTFQDSLSVPSSRDLLTVEDGTDRLSRNISKILPLYHA
jgi:hypothetical protein